MTLQGVTFQGAALENPSKLQGLPDALIELLWQVNGFVAYAGGLHFRGMVEEPSWHSFERYLSGGMSLHHLFHEVREYDIPFGQDFLGNQFLRRDGTVWRLRADTGEMSNMGVDLGNFLGESRESPIEYLGLELLARYHQEHGMLEPGQLIHTMPPLCLARDDSEPSLKAAPADEAVKFLSSIAKQVADVPDGEEVRLELVWPPKESIQ